MLRCGRLNAGHLPVLAAVLAVLTIGGTYMMAVTRGDVDPVLPYISDTAAARPESCVFAQLLNMMAAVVLLVLYLRYRLVNELSRDSDPVLSRLNKFSMFLGCVASLGLSVVANFQESAVFSVHITGALMCFGGSSLYAFIQSVVTRRMYPLYNGYIICVIRAVMAASCMMLFIAGITCGVLASYEFHLAYPDKPMPRPWPGDKKLMAGYEYHLASAVCEWLLTINIICFLLSYSRDFEKLRCAITAQPLVAHLDDTPVSSSLVFAHDST